MLEELLLGFFGLVFILFGMGVYGLMEYGVAKGIRFWLSGLLWIPGLTMCIFSFLILLQSL